MKRSTVSVTIEVDVSHYPYATETKNKTAKKQIIRWIKEATRDSLSFIPLYVDKDENGGVIEDCSRKAKFRFFTTDDRGRAKKV